MRYTRRGYLRYTGRRYLRHMDRGYLRYTDWGYLRYTERGYLRYTDREYLSYMGRWYLRYTGRGSLHWDIRGGGIWDILVWGYLRYPGGGIWGIRGGGIWGKYTGRGYLRLAVGWNWKMKLLFAFICLNLRILTSDWIREKAWFQLDSLTWPYIVLFPLGYSTFSLRIPLVYFMCKISLCAVIEPVSASRNWARIFHSVSPACSGIHCDVTMALNIGSTTGYNSPRFCMQNLL